MAQKSYENRWLAKLKPQKAPAEIVANIPKHRSARKTPTKRTQ